MWNHVHISLADLLRAITPSITGFEPVNCQPIGLTALPFKLMDNASYEDLILRAGFEPTMSYVNDAGNMIKSSFSEKSRSDQDRSNQESKDLHILPKPTSVLRTYP